MQHSMCSRVRTCTAPIPLRSTVLTIHTHTHLHQLGLSRLELGPSRLILIAAVALALPAACCTLLCLLVPLLRRSCRRSKRLHLCCAEAAC